MLQLIGFLVLVLSIFIGYDSASGLARGEISMKEAVSNLKAKVVRLIGENPDNDEGSDLSTQVGNLSGSEPDLLSGPETYQPAPNREVFSEPVPQGSDGKTAARARQLLLQSQSEE